MKTITITGASDDLIEVDGDIEEEFNPPFDDRDVYLAVSDGTLLRVKYDEDGIWRIAKIIGGSADFEKVEGDAEADTFDKVTMTGDIRWVAMASAYAPRRAAKAI